MIDSVFITLECDLAKLNEHDSSNRNNKFGGAALKKRMTDMVTLLYQPKNIKIDYPVMIGFTWYYSGRHDFDNIRFACKYILDGLVKAGVLINDNQTWVKGFLYDRFRKVEKGKELVIVELEKHYE